jgi:hypothetical protein
MEKSSCNRLARRRPRQKKLHSPKNASRLKSHRARKLDCLVKGNGTKAHRPVRNTARRIPRCVGPGTVCVKRAGVWGPGNSLCRDGPGCVGPKTVCAERAGVCGPWNSLCLVISAPPPTPPRLTGLDCEDIVAGWHSRPADRAGRARRCRSAAPSRHRGVAVWAGSGGDAQSFH